MENDFDKCSGPEQAICNKMVFQKYITKVKFTLKMVWIWRNFDFDYGTLTYKKDPFHVYQDMINNLKTGYPDYTQQNVDQLLGKNPTKKQGNTNIN